MTALKILLIMLIAGFSIGELPPPERSYKILMLLPNSSKSHRNMFVPLAEALGDRGHKVTMLTGQNKTSKHPNIDEMFHGLPYMYSDDVNIFEARRNILPMLNQVTSDLTKMAKDIYQVPNVKQLYNKRREFDLVIVMLYINEVMYPFLHEMPFITLVTFGVDSCQSAEMGNPFHPAYVNNFYRRVDLSNIFSRLLNTILLAPPFLCWRDWVLFPFLQKEITSQFPHLPSLVEIERNHSLTLVNSHFSMETFLPLLPSQIEVGGMHCHPGQPLSKDLETWIEGAGPAGVVYFSLGSIAKGETMPLKYRSMFVEVFKKLKQRVIWKFEGEMAGVSKNVLIRNWLPQQDILAHPNVKVFISHGGGLSTQESSYHGVPMLVLPLIADQPKNAEHIAAAERGINLLWEDLSPDLILNSLLEIINNTKYKNNMVSVSKAFKDQPQTPIDRAVFWTEYVIRHQGAPQLRSPAAKLSWTQFFLLDVITIITAFLAVITLTFYAVFRKILQAIFGNTDKKKRE